MAGLLDRIIKGMNNLLSFFEPGYILKVFRNRLSGYGHTIPMQHAILEHEFQDGRDTAYPVNIFHQVFSAGFQVCQERRLIADPLKVIQGE